MTSTTDEIANLRAALEDIAQRCAHAGPGSYEYAQLITSLGVLARRALKGPRASKITTRNDASCRALLGQWLDAVNQPVVDHVMHTVNDLLVEVSDRGAFTREQCKTILMEVVAETPAPKPVFDIPLLDQSTPMDSHTPKAAHGFAPDNTFP